MPSVKSELQMTYTITDDRGTMNVAMTLTPERTSVEEMFRFGVVVELPYAMDNSQYYGRGPIENSADRKISQRIGLYQQTADQQFYPYIRPQETGTKSDIRWWKQTYGNSGNGINSGILITADTPFYASALHYNIEDLTEPEQTKAQRHSPEVPQSRYTNLSLDLEHTGVGGINCWNGNARALPEYRVMKEEKTFRFTITPLK